MSFNPETNEDQTIFDSDNLESSEIHFPTEKTIPLTGGAIEASFEPYISTVPKIPINIEQLLDPDMQNPAECKMQKELMLEQQGLSRNLQMYRYNLYKKASKPPSHEINFSYFLNIERCLREDCHWEIALEKEKWGDENSRTYHHSIDDKLKELRRRIWYATAKWWRFRAYMLESSGLLARGFMSWRSNPQWYMHSVLIEDCKARGGCCSRDCGCCTDPGRAKSSAGSLGIGHCTLRCGCCEESREFKVDPDLEKMMSDVFLSDGKIRSKSHEEVLYSNRLCLASIWGLSMDGGTSTSGN